MKRFALEYLVLAQRLAREMEFVYPTKTIRVHAMWGGYRRFATNQLAQIIVHQMEFVLETRIVRALMDMKIQTALHSRVLVLVNVDLMGNAQGLTLAPANKDFKVEIAILPLALECSQQILECVMEMVLAFP